MSHKQSMDMFLTAWNASRTIRQRRALSYALTYVVKMATAYIPVCEITKGKTVSSEQSKRVLWK